MPGAPAKSSAGAAVAEAAATMPRPAARAAASMVPVGAAERAVSQPGVVAAAAVSAVRVAPSYSARAAPRVATVMGAPAAAALGPAPVVTTPTMTSPVVAVEAMVGAEAEQWAARVAVQAAAAGQPVPLSFRDRTAGRARRTVATDRWSSPTPVEEIVPNVCFVEFNPSR